VPFRVVQEPKYAEELVGILYIKTPRHYLERSIRPHARHRCSRPESPPDRGTRPGGVKIGKIEALYFSRDRRTAGERPQKAMFSIKTNEDRPYGTFARGAAGIGYGRQR
jgi:hypothetical protein